MSLAGLPTYLLLVNTKTFFKCSKYFFKYSVWAGLDLKAPKTLNMMHRRSKKWDVGIWTNRWYIIPWGRIDYLDNIVHSEGQLMFDFLIRNIFNISHPQAQSSPLSSEHSWSLFKLLRIRPSIHDPLQCRKLKSSSHSTPHEGGTE